MDIKVRDLLKVVGILIFSMAVLFFCSATMKPVELGNLKKEQQKVMEQLLPGSKSFEEEAYEGDDENISKVFRGEDGYVIETVTDGYVNEMTLWVGVNLEGDVTGVMVEDMAETWGLGQKAMTDMTFLEQFLDGTGEAVVGENVDALTGATVSSKAVTRAVNSAVAFVTGADIASGATEWGG